MSLERTSGWNRAASAQGTVRINRPAVIDDDFGGEAVVMHLGNGRYYSLNQSATHLWRLIAEPRSVPNLTSLFDDAVTAEAFVLLLLDEGLLVTDELAQPVPFPPDQANVVFVAPPKLERFDDMQDLLLLDPVHDIAIDGDGWPTGHAQDPAQPR